MKLNWYFIKKGIPNISNLGFCVTAWTKEDAIYLLEKRFSLIGEFDSNKDITKLNSLEELEKDHVLPNIGNPIPRGIWFPSI